MGDRVGLLDLCSELGVPIGKVMKKAGELNIKSQPGTNSKPSYSQEDADTLRTLILEDLAIEAEDKHSAEIKEAEKAERRQWRLETLAGRKARREARATREPSCIWNGLIPVSALTKLRNMTVTLSTPERRYSQGEILSMALDALEHQFNKEKIS